MAKTQVLEYTIHLTDQATVDLYNAQLDAGTGPGTLLRYYSAAAQGLVYGVLRAPYDVGPPEGGASIEFSAPLQADSVAFLAPCTRSPWFTGGANFPTNVATFTRKSGGWFGISLLFGTTTRFYWVGRFAFAPLSTEQPNPPVTPTTPTTPPVLLARRWIDGFELPGAPGGEGGNTFNTPAIRDASRTADGFGFGARSTATKKRHDVMENRGGGASDKQTAWERFYIRVRRYPSTGEVDLWEGTPSSGNCSVVLRITSTGVLKAYALEAAAENLIGTGSTIPLNTWKKIDCVLGLRGITPIWASDAPVGNGPGNLYTPGQWVTRSVSNYICLINTSVPQGSDDNDPLNSSGDPYWELTSLASRVASLRVYINGSSDIDGDGDLLPAASATNATFYHEDSRLGSAAANDAEIDFDDWVGHDCPEIQQAWTTGADLDAYPDYTTLESHTDFKSGSHCQLIQPSGVVSQTDWTGAWQLALQRPVENTGTSNRLTSSTSGALLALSGDVSPASLRQGAVGVGAVVVGWHGTRGAGSPGNDTVGAELTFDPADPTVEFSEAAAPPSAGTLEWRSAFYDADGVDPAPVLTAIELRFTHGADSLLRTVSSLHAVIEIIGVFGPEDGDYPTVPAVSPHNSQYPFSPWETHGAPSFGAVAAISGSYVSDGLPRDLEFPLPVHWLWIRRTSGIAAQMVGARWWTSMFTSHFDLQQPIVPYAIPMALRDSGFAAPDAEDEQEMQWLVRIATADPIINESGATYCYTAFCDPAARFLRCGSSQHSTPFPISESLPDPNFTPKAGFFFPEDRGVTSTNRMAYKGPTGHPVAGAQLLTGAALTDYVDFSAGSISERTNFFPSGCESTAYALFRHDDGNGDAAVFQTATYTGNATNPRTIDLLPAFGIRPIFGIVVGLTNGRQRDTSHTGTTSTNIDTGESVAANGISGGGIDQIIVGSDLNQSGVTYYVFVIPGDDTAGEGGWGVPGEFFNVEPDSSTDPGWEEPTEVEGADEPGSDLTTFVDDEPALVAFTITDEDALSGLDADGVVTDLCRYVLHRLGDSAQTIWTKAEVGAYLALAATEMAIRTRILWDQFFLDDIIALTGQFSDPPSAVTILHKDVTEVQRATWQTRPIEALSPRDLARSDTRYEITTGEIFGYTWRKDGVRDFRLVRAPAENPTEVRVDHWRHFEAQCSLSELPPRYFLYLADYMQQRALTKFGPGQNYKLAQLYKDRWERGIARIIKRVGRQNKERTGRMGGTSPGNRGGPPRARLPWNYGSRVR